MIVNDSNEWRDMDYFRVVEQNFYIHLHSICYMLLIPTSAAFVTGNFANISQYY